MTDCKATRRLLTSANRSGAAGAALPETAEAHLKNCAACAQYARRIDAARRFFAEHRADAAPDVAFAGRVVARLPDPTTDVLGRAALRLLPASIALLLVLGWFAWQAAPLQVGVSETAAADVTAPTDDLLGWVLEEKGNGS